MMKKIMIAGFWALLLIPNLLFPFVKGGSQTGTGENRNLCLLYTSDAADEL